jgi:hypothetical protein
MRFSSYLSRPCRPSFGRKGHICFMGSIGKAQEPDGFLSPAKHRSIAAVPSVLVCMMDHDWRGNRKFALDDFWFAELYASNKI